MGDMLSSSKHGKGLLLHDDGATVVSEYSHDTPTGHNIIFRDNSITSILFRNALDYEIAYKVTPPPYRPIGTSSRSLSPMPPTRPMGLAV
jgi:hypothetical protein